MSILVRDLHYRLKVVGDARPLADGIDVGFAAGTISAIVGPSGSGKSTLIGLMGGLLDPDRGTVTVCGQEWSKDESQRCLERRRRVGFVFQDIRLLRQLNVYQNILTPALFALEDRRAAEAAAQEILSDLDIKIDGSLYPQKLSGGEQQQVALARALVGKPSAILADEPTAALDWERGMHFLDILRKRTRQEELVTVIVTHDSRVLSFVDKVYELRSGRLYARD
jgi:putative ABC transport system ATP-binding protein